MPQEVRASIICDMQVSHASLLSEELTAAHIGAAATAGA